MRPFNILPSKNNNIPRVSRLYLKMRSKFAVSFLFLILLPFIAFMVFAYIQSKAALEHNTYEINTRIINQLESAVRNLLDKLDASTLSCASDPDIYNIMVNTSENGASMTDISNKLNNIVLKHLTPELYKDFCGIYIIRENKILAAYDKNKEPAIISNPSSQSWFKEAVGNPAETLILGTSQRFYEKGENIPVFPTAKVINSLSDKTPSVMLIDFDYSILADMLNPVDASGNLLEERIITDDKNTVLFSNDQKIVTLALDTKISDIIGEREHGFTRLNYDGEDRYMTFARYSNLSWTFISMLPAESVLNKLMPGNNPMVPVCIILAIAILLLYFIVSSSLLSPINELTAVISGFEKGNFTSNSDISKHSGAQLTADSPGNTSEIDYLINKIYSIRLKQKEAELNSLQNQINPHFLYNTLESIRGAALYHGIHDIAAMSKALSFLFRYSISDRVLVTIKEELQHLENYMSIQNFRYENKFELVYSIPYDLYDYKILKLILQPLIENSIKHGLEMKLGKGIIKIEILSLQNNIKIEISDNGLGIPQKKIEELNRALAKDEHLVVKNESSDRTGTGIGVRNVNSRIKLYFGEQYGLRFRDAITGTVVEITLPVVKEN